MVLQGHVQNGVIVIDDPADLPEGARVRVEVFANAGLDPASEPERRRGGMWLGQVKIADNFDVLPEDLAEAFGLDAS